MSKRGRLHIGPEHRDGMIIFPAPTTRRDAKALMLLLMASKEGTERGEAPKGA